MKKTTHYLLTPQLWIMTLALFAAMGTFAQNTPPITWTIKGHIQGLKDTDIFLANYYGKQVYYNDTARVDAKGNFSFEGKAYEDGGKYMLLLSDNRKRFDFIVDDKDIFVELDTTFSIDKIKFTKSENNQIFFDYIRYINTKIKERTPIDEVLKLDSTNTHTEAEKETARKKLEKLNEEVITYQKKLIADHPNMLVSKMIKMSMDIEIPEAPKDLSEDERKKWQYYWFRDHFWDNVDLKDPRLVRDPSFHKLTEKYITQTLPQIPDTMTYFAKKLIDQTAGNKHGFRYIVHNFTYNFETSKIMCMDEGFVYMVDNYYSKGLCNDWMKEDKLKSMKEAADEKRNCLCGEIGLNIILPDLNDQWRSMYDLDSKYTLLVIWEASCGHCKKEVPKLQELYEKWKDRGLEIYGVHNNLEVDKWKKFVADNQLTFTNVCRNQFIMNQDSATKLIYGGITTLQSLNYHQYWDVNSTPKVFLMDKDHKIIAKSLGSEQLDELLERLEKGETEIAPIKEHEYEDEDAPKGGVKPGGKPRPTPQNPKQLPRSTPGGNEQKK